MTAKPPVRMSLTDLRNAETWVMQYNPTEVTETLGANYNELEVPGLSFQPMQYKGNTNHAWKLELRNIRHADRGHSGREPDFDMDQFKNYLQSLTLPSATAQNIATADPAKVLFVWPKLVSMVCRIMHPLEFKHVRFARNGRPIESIITLNLKEVAMTRLTAEQVRAAGTFRS